MKIAFIGGRDIHTLGGIENYMLNLTAELTKLGNTSVVYCESDHNAVETYDGVKVKYWAGPKNALICKPLLGLKSTLDAIFNEKVDFIHYNAWPPSLSCWLARISGVHSLMEGHGLEWQRSKYSPTEQKIMRFMEAVTARMNEHLIMCSDIQVQYFKDRYGIDSVCIPGAVHLPVDPNKDCSRILNSLGLGRQRFLLFMGRLVPDKNPNVLIEAFNFAVHDGYKLVIAGDNPAMPEYVAYLHELASHREDIVFTGAVYGEYKNALLASAYCLCLPSTIEGLSIALLEASSYRLPVIASDIDANVEFLGSDAMFVRPENVEDLTVAIENAIANPSVMADYAKHNYEKVVESYTWDKVARKYDNYIHGIFMQR